MKSRMLLLFITIVTFWSCTKTNFETQPTEVVSQERMSGVLPDPPELKKNFSFRGSKEFIENGRTVAFNKNGKKIVDMRIADAELLMKGTAAKGTKGGGWGQGGNPGSGGTGGSTGGGTTGGGGTTQTDFTPPRIIGLDPASGRVFNLAGQWQQIELFAWVDDETQLARIKVTVRGDVLLDSAGPFLQGYGNFNTIRIPYKFPFGDGTYDMVWQAWDKAGNTVIASSVFSRNTEFTAVPDNLPTSYILPHMVNENSGKYIYQGGEGACAAFAVNSAYTIQKYVHGGLTGGYNDNNVYSPEWIYNYGHMGTCGSGSAILYNMSIVVNKGVPTWAVLPFDYNNGCDTGYFTQSVKDAALLNKGIWGFNTMTADINAIKYNIYKGYVGAFGYQLASDMASSGPGFVWNFPHLQDYSTHASCIIGYDDSKHAWLMLNSWGPTWADQGCIWIDYDFMWQAVSGALYYFGN